MFVEAIEKVSKFTRPIHTITRVYGSDEVQPGAATLFFVNELGHAVTCKHVATLIVQAKSINKKYQEFKAEINKLPSGDKRKKKLRELEEKYKYSKDVVVQIKNTFVGCIDKIEGFLIEMHPIYDLAIIKFAGFTKLFYEGYATFIKDSSMIKQGKMLCRLGYPFPEFTNFKYEETTDDIVWTKEGRQNTPRFPIEGMVTRNILGRDNIVVGIEMSTPGLRGQSGSALFDKDGLIYGMQSRTNHLYLGFDIKDKEIRIEGKKKKVSNHPFLHLGSCVHVDVIKAFLKEKSVKFYEK